MVRLRVRERSAFRYAFPAEIQLPSWTTMALLPGSVVLAGTPWRCGCAQEVRHRGRSGDISEVGADGIGTLTNSLKGVPRADA